MTTEVLVGTRKGLFVLRGPRDGRMSVHARYFEGQTVEFALRDARTGLVVASVTHDQFGPHVFVSGDPDSGWDEADGPAFPDGTDAAVQRTWTLVEGAAEGTLWAGVAPAALFRSVDGGRSWKLERSLWEVPDRPAWQPGGGGLCLHSICPWPGEPGRLAVGISAAGVWLTDDDGASWRRGGAGLVPRYLPEEARAGSHALCVHDMQRAPLRPERMFIQFHGGVYRSDDAGESWTEISEGLPADFGFPLVVDPRSPDRAFVIPMCSDTDRTTVGGRVAVWETTDAGATWAERGTGLPDRDAYLTVLRQAFAHDGRDPLGLYFGATSGELFASNDGGESWRTLARRLPPVLSVRVGRLE